MDITEFRQLLERFTRAAEAGDGDAFAACRQLIDDLKAEVPIWKHQVFADGQEEWVGSP